MKHQQTDILIIGLGLAGMTAAISAAKSGKQITIISKTKSLQSGNTPWAQGGIIYKGLNDSPQKLKKDILNAGAGHCWEEAVNQLCQHGPELVEEILLEKLNTSFDRNQKGLKSVAEGAHTGHRRSWTAVFTHNKPQRSHRRWNCDGLASRRTLFQFTLYTVSPNFIISSKRKVFNFGSSQRRGRQAHKRQG